MKAIQTVIGSVVGMAVLGGVWVVTLHGEWLKPHAQTEEEKPAETDVAVRTAAISRATLRQYVEGYGAVEPEPGSGGKPSAGAAIAAPSPGMVAGVLCEIGQRVEKDAVLIQLDDRLARAQEEQALAMLESAKATLSKLKSMPRPEQLEIARLTVEKANISVGLTEKNYARQQKLAPEQVASAKTLQAAEAEMNAAKVDLQTAEKQLALLKASPTPEELGEANAKLREAERTVSVAQTQASLLKITAPMAATVLRVAVNKGEAVDPTKVLVELAALDRLTVNATVSARQLSSLKPGMAAEVRVIEMAAGSGGGEASAATKPAAGGSADSIAGVVKLIGYQVDRKTDTVQVWVSLPANAGVRPGQYARVRIITDEHADRLAVPVDSVVTDADGNSVVALVVGNKAAQKRVQVGLRDRNLVEVEAEGLKEGDAVVSEGAYGLPKETKIHVIGG